jgi:hypothetical protein
MLAPIRVPASQKLISINLPKREELSVVCVEKWSGKGMEVLLLDNGHDGYQQHETHKHMSERIDD